MNKSIIAMGVLIAMSLGAAAQTPDEVYIESDENVKLEILSSSESDQLTEKEAKEREKRMRELKDDVAYGKASNSLRRGYFVFLADNIQFSSGNYILTGLDQRSNFVLVQDFDGIIQLSPLTGRPGVNGLGGWTAKGTVRNKRIKYLDNGDVFLEFQFVSSWLNTNVTITLFHNSKQAVAYILGPNIKIYGEILPYRDKEHR